MSEHLEVCWHISPPWRDRVPPLFFRIKERVYVHDLNLIGWVSGAVWHKEEYNWAYSICTHGGYYRRLEKQLRSCKRLQIVSSPLPKLQLGEIALIRGVGRRVTQGILLNGNCQWLYGFERNIPTLDAQFGDRIAWYSDEEILKLEAAL